MSIVKKNATKDSCLECFKMTNFDRFHREAMRVMGFDNVSNYAIDN